MSTYIVSSGQTSTGITLNINDTMLVSAGGSAGKTVVRNGGLMTVAGTAGQTGVSSGGALLVSGGKASYTEIASYGNMYVSGGGTVSYTSVFSSARLTVNGGTASGTVVSGGTMWLSSGGAKTGAAYMTDVRSGIMAVKAGGYAYRTSVFSGSLNISGGGAAELVAVSYGSVAVSVGGMVSSADVGIGGGMTVFGGASATGAVINSYGSVHLSGGTALGAAVNALGSLHVSKGGSAGGTVVNSGGCMYVSDGGAVTGTDVCFGGFLYVSDGGSADSTGIGSGGRMYVFSGGSADSTVVGGSADSTGVGCSMSVSGGTARKTSIGVSGSMYVNSGGLVESTSVNSLGYLCVSQGGSAVGTVVSSLGSVCVSGGGSAVNTTVSSGGFLYVSDGGKITGNMSFAPGADVLIGKGGILDFDISVRTESSPALADNLTSVSGSDPCFTVTVSSSQTSGTYKLAEGAAGFDAAITVWRSGPLCDEELGVLSVGETLTAGDDSYTLNLTTAGSLTLTVGGEAPGPGPGPGPEPGSEPPRVNLLENGVSQVLAWDVKQGKVGFMATDGNPSPAWRGVWEWSTAYSEGLGASEAELWKVVAAGKFSGSAADRDGILLYNGIGNTFAAWTDLNDPSYGYVSLCHVDGNFQTKCLGDFDGNGFDDVIIYDENGSVGIVSDAARYHDVWHAEPGTGTVNPWELLGAGRFAGSQDSILFRNATNGHLYLWDNQGSDVATWNWRQTDIGYLADGWEFAAIGDFAGDGIDDIVLVNTNDSNAVFVWDNGDRSAQHYVGILGEGFKIETVGDYDGDGREDLLLREYNSGWGGIGCWSGASASAWTDFNARIETDMESKFAIIA